MRNLTGITVLAGLFFSISAFATTFEDNCVKIGSSGGKDGARLAKLMAETWRWQETESPEDATFNGFPGVNDRWSDLSRDAIERRKRELEAPLRALRKIKRQRLSAEDRLNYD